MTDGEESLQDDVDAILNAVQSKRAKRPNLGPVEWEAMAQYVLDLYRMSEANAVRYEQLLSNHPGSAFLEMSVMTNRVTSGVVRHLANVFRTGKNGPWNRTTPLPKAAEYQPPPR
jgi:hypothetical protein